MKIKIDGKTYEGHTVELILDNTNRLSIFEIDPGSVQIKNITDVTNEQEELGLMFELVDHSTINMTPEG